MTEKKAPTKRTTSKAGGTKSTTKSTRSTKAAAEAAATEEAVAAPDAVIPEVPSVATPDITEAKVTIEASPVVAPAEAEIDDMEVDDATDEADLGPPPEGMFSLEQCVEFVLRAIVQNQEALTIVKKDEPDKVRISVAVAPEDLGKVIGKQGRTINALRTVVKTAAARTNTQVVVDLEGKAD